jgi:hypothetical protein
MIHHVSIPARDPRHVAEVLAELLQGRIYPFPPFWCRDAYQIVSGDPHGTMLEVYPDSYWLEPIDSIFKKVEPVPFHPFHMLVSVPGRTISREPARPVSRRPSTVIACGSRIACCSNSCRNR